MTIEEFNNLKPDQEVFFIKKPKIKKPLTFSSGVHRFNVHKKQYYNSNISYKNVKKGDFWWEIKEIDGNKKTRRSIHQYTLDEWYLSRNEALYNKLCLMKYEIQKCKAPALKSQPAFKYKLIIQQKKVIKLAGIYPEFFI